MDCQNCNELLLDLAYGELDEVRAAAMRKHCDGCADCRGALARIRQGRALARQLVPEEPAPISPVLRAAVMAAAARAAEGSSVSRPMVAPARSISVNSELGGNSAGVGRAARWFERVGELAMRRQVAMAAVFVITISVGFIYYQSHPRPDGVPDFRSPDVVPAVEVSTGPAARTPPSTAQSAGRARTNVPSGNVLVRVQPTPVAPPRTSDDQRADAPPSRPSPVAVAPSNVAATNAPPRALGGNSVAGSYEITPQHQPVPVAPPPEPGDEMRPAPQTPPLGVTTNTQQYAQQQPPSTPSGRDGEQANTAANAPQVPQRAEPTPASNAVPSPSGNYASVVNGESQTGVALPNTGPNFRAPDRAFSRPGADVHGTEVQLRQQIATLPPGRDRDERRFSLARSIPISGRYDEAIALLRQVETPELRARAQIEIEELERARASMVERSRHPAQRVARPPVGNSVLSRPRRGAPPSPAPNETRGSLDAH